MSHLGPFTIPVLAICYYPLRGNHIDRRITGDVGNALADIRAHVARTSDQVVAALEKGSAYHGYKEPFASPPCAMRSWTPSRSWNPCPSGTSRGCICP